MILLVISYPSYLLFLWIKTGYQWFRNLRELKFWDKGDQVIIKGYNGYPIIDTWNKSYVKLSNGDLVKLRHIRSNIHWPMRKKELQIEGFSNSLKLQKEVRDILDEKYGKDGITNETMAKIISHVKGL